MEYKTIIAPTYEQAVNQAKQMYGDRLRIISRRAVSRSAMFGFSHTSECELKFYLTDEPVIDSLQEEELDEILDEAEEEKEEPSVDTAIQSENQEEVNSPTQVDFFLEIAEKLLITNDFSSEYIEWLKIELKTQLSELGNKTITEEEFELRVLDIIAGSIKINQRKQNSPSKILVILGPESSGKTTTLVKLAALYGYPSSESKRDVRIVTLDNTPNVVTKLKKIGQVINADIVVAVHEDELSHALNMDTKNPLILVDTLGKPINSNEIDYKLYGLINVADPGLTDFIVIVPATMKNSDIEVMFQQLKLFTLSAIIVTRMDETTTFGNVMSLSHDRNLPLIFLTDGRKIPKDIKKPTVELLLKTLKGFHVDINKVFDSQV